MSNHSNPEGDNMMKKEIWKVSITLPQYEISNMGRVRNTEDKQIKKIYDNHKSGYIYIQYSENGRCRSKKLHRLVAELYCENPDNKETVNHINGIKSDNRAENLEWMTLREYDTRLRKWTYTCHER